MKKLIISLLAITTLIACSNNSGTKEDKKEDKKGKESTDLSANPDYQKGLELVSKSDCFTCHKIDEPLTGPPYRDVANKYAGQPDTIVSYLARKVREGGSGVYGQVPMTPHPSISEADAEAMVKYVLLLKK
jgi:cytochrome c